MPPLLLQRPPWKHCTIELSRHLERHLSIWESGDLASLFQDGRAIQARLPLSPSSVNSDFLSRKFSNLMFVGNVKVAIRLLSDNECGGIHSLDNMIDYHSVKDLLLEKHPSAEPPHLSTWCLHPLQMSFTLSRLTPSPLSWSDPLC